MLLIPAGNASEWTGRTGNNTYLLTGRVPALIDAGVGKTSHVEAVAAALEGAPLALVLITHAHADHMSGVNALANRWPNLEVRKMPPDLKTCRRPISPDERIDADDTSVIAIHTPGHSPDHCCFFDESSGDLVCGDLVRAGGTIVIPATRGGDLVEYLDSLRRVGELKPRRLLPGHGPIVENPAALIDEYLRHRAERETQIVAALQAGCHTPEQIVARVYGPIAAGLLPAALETATAHLVKLEKERRAIQLKAGSWELGERLRPEGGDGV